ncbi:response regulator transcription factor [Candidatus Poribacteria bacterium]|nr:response regulator transcription factor [Candidatus Poribacteria bacterium]
MSKEKILIVEDDKNISQLIKYNLEKADFECAASYTGEDVPEILNNQNVDLILLDLMLPKINGLEICRMIKQDKRISNIPIIILTAKGEEIDKVVGFELGADDYVVKPFSPRELILRIKAILKRNKPEEDIKNILTQDELKIDIAKHTVTIGHKEIEFTAMEFKLLVMLMQRKGYVQTREKLLDDVWEIGADVTTRTVDTHIKRVRKKLGKYEKFIETIRNVGYKFSADE